ncbi:MAG: hypothetical protein U1E48_08875 [Paracoccaceae bacterium]
MRAVLLGVVLALLGLVQEAAGEEKYFPPGVWGPVPKGSNESAAERDDGYEKWLGAKLAKLGESPLWEERAKAGVPFAIRVSYYPGAVIPDSDMIRLMVDAKGSMRFVYSGFRFRDFQHIDTQNPDLVPVHERKKVDGDLAKEILDAVSEIAPYTGKTPSTIPNEGGFDGTTVLFEFSRNGTYNAMTRTEQALGNDDPLARLLTLIARAARAPSN